MICPRCDSDAAYEVHEGEGGCWKIMRCPRCNFNWRDTERPEVTTAALYDARFKLTEEKIAAVPKRPVIPPLKGE